MIQLLENVSSHVIWLGDLSSHYRYELCSEFDLCVCVCFQAEDGIRYLVRSRGLGDVYKRQH